MYRIYKKVNALFTYSYIAIYSYSFTARMFCWLYIYTYKNLNYWFTGMLSCFEANGVINICVVNIKRHQFMIVYFE